MAITGKQSPFGAGLNGSLLQDIGLCLNPITAGYVGTSHVHNYNDGDDTYTPGSVVNNTCLKWLTHSIRKGYDRVRASQISSTTYGNLINIGGTTVPALGNAKSSTFTWYGPANSGDPTSQAAQAVSWYPYQATNTTNVYPTSYPTARQYSSLTQTSYYRSITQWGWVRLFALQGWNEFNWNNDPAASSVLYKDFLSSFNTVAGFINYSNTSVNSLYNGKSFLKNTYSNVDDLISSDISGINKATSEFGQDLITSGKAIDLTKISSFGMPSTLLMTLKKYNALTNALTLALISSGIPINVLSAILSKSAIPTKLQEQQIYGAFNIIRGVDLANILIPLNCNTTGLESLADLLNPIKLFPNSYQSLTVPIYNTGPGPTNAKTYYLVYQNNGINNTLKSPAIANSIGILGIAPPSTSAPDLNTNFQAIQPGFDSYLKGVLPEDIAIACGAFSVAVQQVKNVQNIPIEKFAQVVANIETTKGLPLAAGTDVPSNVPLLDGGLTQTAFGTGPNGSWVMSDFLGSMSGLPYPWKDITNLISNSETVKLRNIYQELYLAINWEGAVLTPIIATQQVEISPGVFQTQYQLTGITITNKGGGYGRGGATAPTITITNGTGASATATIGVDTSTAVYSTGSYGTITSVAVTPGGWGTSVPTVSVEYPPTATLAVTAGGAKATGGTNTASGTTGWASPMEAVVQAYITQAETEIAAIQTQNPQVCATLNKNWNITGTQLTVEQRARDMVLQPVPSPKDNRLNPYPIAIHAYIDSLPNYSQRTEPHMYAQTIDAISDMSTVGGQLQIAHQRAERNQQRLISAGIPLDDTIPGEQTPLTLKILMGNGTASTAARGVPASPAIFTIPANQEVVGAQPQGYFSQTDNSYIVASMSADTLLGSIPDNANPGQDEAGPNIQQVLNPITPIAGNRVNGVGQPLTLGGPIVPGSLAGSPYRNLIPPQLSVPFISGIVSPSTYSVNEAIDEVVRCNCDCWLA